MLAPMPPEDPRQTFEQHLHGAITGARISHETPDMIARQHPETDVELIADAYVVYARHNPSEE
jgi:hypothetical protein